MGTKLNLSGIVSESIVDGPGIRMTLFTQGCPHHCKGCHNPETWAFEQRHPGDVDKILAVALKNPILQGLTFSGGEPFCQAEACAYMAERLKGDYHLLCFTGYTFEQLLEMGEKDKDIMRFLELLDVIIDGRFELEKRSLELRFKGSTNQRTIDVKESIRQGRAVEIEI